MPHGRVLLPLRRAAGRRVTSDPLCSEDVMATSPQFVDRRRSPRESPRGAPGRSVLESLIAGTYREMPGLVLTLPQAARLFGLRDLTCRVLLEDLVRQGRLRRLKDGQYAAV